MAFQQPLCSSLEPLVLTVEASLTLAGQLHPAFPSILFHHCPLIHEEILIQHLLITIQGLTNSVHLLEPVSLLILGSATIVLQEAEMDGILSMAPGGDMFRIRGGVMAGTTDTFHRMMAVGVRSHGEGEGNGMCRVGTLAHNKRTALRERRGNRMS